MTSKQKIVKPAAAAKKKKIKILQYYVDFYYLISFFSTKYSKNKIPSYELFCCCQKIALFILTQHLANFQ
jgi:hypothetical protein